MEKVKLNGNGMIANGEIYVPHLGECLAFSLSPTDRHFFNRVMNSVDKSNRLRATIAQNLSLIDLALKNPRDNNCLRILDNFHTGYLWTSTENLTGENDIAVYDNVDGKTVLYSREEMNLNKAVRIVPLGFRTGRQPINQFLENPYVLAQIGDERMLDVVERVIRGISNRNPSVCVPEISSIDDWDKGRYTAIGGKEHNGFWLSGDYNYCCGNGHGYGYAHGVRKVSPEEFAQLE